MFNEEKLKDMSLLSLCALSFRRMQYDRLSSSEKEIVRRLEVAGRLYKSGGGLTGNLILPADLSEPPSSIEEMEDVLRDALEWVTDQADHCEAREETYARQKLDRLALHEKVSAAEGKRIAGELAKISKDKANVQVFPHMTRTT